MFDQPTRLDVLKKLQDLQYPYTIEKMLQERNERIQYSKKYKGPSARHHCYERIEKYEKNIELLKNIRNKFKGKEMLSIAFSANETEEEILKKVKKIKKSSGSEESTVKANVFLDKKKKTIIKRAFEISLYFSQGYEMYKTSIDMNISSSPIIEYYAILQIIKAIILLELDVDSHEFFGAHGLERKKSKDGGSILQVKTKTFGVFASLLLRTCGFSFKKDGSKEYELDKYYNNYYPKFEDLIDKESLYLSTPEAFIFIWILSEIARYQPEKWKEICSGRDNDWIKTINNFREEGIPKFFFDLLNFYCN